MITRRLAIWALATGAMMSLTACSAGLPGTNEARKEIGRAGLTAAASVTLDRLSASQPEAASVISEAQALLIFPEIIKGGLVIGAASGDGVWQAGGATQGYYRSTAVSYGLQAGVTSFGYVMAFMDQASIDYVQNSDGWEVGIGPVVTVADEGFAKKYTTTTLNEGVVVFFVDQAGFFAGAGIEGTNITRL